MPRKILESNRRIEVRVDPGWRGGEPTVPQCEEVRRLIAKHVDGIGGVHVIVDKDFVCEHCGYAWTERSPDYNGGCCEKDEANNPDAALTNDDGLVPESPREPALIREKE